MASLSRELTPDEIRRITVVIPAKDEAQTIGAIIQGCKPYAGEILVVDGHSADGTRAVAEELGARVILDNKKGKGDAIRCAISQIKTPVTVFIDADGSHDPDDIPKLVAPIFGNQADHVTGSRLIGGSSELHGGFDEFLRLTGSSFITAMINWYFKVSLSDSQNGFRAIRTAVLPQLGIREDLTTIEQEMIIRTLKRGFVMGEAPAHEHKRKAGESHIRLSRIWFWYGWSLVKNLFLL